MRVAEDFFDNKRVLVLGLAKSGYYAALLLQRLRAHVIVNEFKEIDAEDQYAKDLTERGIQIVSGGHPLSLLDGLDLIVKSPGIPYRNSLLVEAAKRNIPIVTEVEIPSLASDCEFIGITGTNGKTTTTVLLHQMLTAGGLDAHLAGNIGEVTSRVIEEVKSDALLVTELSSFQLMGMPSFHPHVSILLNLDEAHLDFHESIEEYHQAKCMIFKNQSADDFFVYNAEQAEIVLAAASANCQLVPFSTLENEPNGACIVDGIVYFKGEAIMPMEKIQLPGSHNLENILAAISVAKLYNVSNEKIVQVLSTFSGVAHRLEYVTTINKRLIYNNSKSTNIKSTQTALAAFEQPIVLIAGGLDRGIEFDDLRPYTENVKAIVAYGQTQSKFAKLAETMKISCGLADSLAEATVMAYDFSEPGDVILLSPACASWDQFRSFEERGDMFKQQVTCLEEKIKEEC